MSETTGGAHLDILFDPGHRFVLAVVLTYNPETNEYAAGIRRGDFRHPKVSPSWIADRLRQLGTDYELQAMLSPEEGEHEEDSRNGKS